MIDRVVAAIQACRYSYVSEDELQRALDGVLTREGFTVEREVVLSGRDRIDLVVDHTIGIEVKIDGQTRSIASQLDRYAEHDRFSHLILVTTRNRHLIACNRQRRIPVRGLCLAEGGL